VSVRTPRILLLDLDGTLVDTGGAGRRALVDAFAQVEGAPDPYAGFPFSGLTDPVIVGEGLRRAGIAVTPERIARILEVYVARLAHHVQRTPRYRVLPGARALVERALALGDAVGLSTGNVEAGARLKLAPAQLFARLAFGGFGSDSADRAELTQHGADRGRARLGVEVPRQDVWVVGDSPYDVRAGRAIGARTIAVLTGWSSREELEGESPDLLVDTLEALAW